jgi:hypothetical protein
MTKVNVVRSVRATLDRENPGWRDALRREMTAKDPNWVVAGATVRGVDGESIEVALLANPERVPDPSEIDPETDPFRE